MKKIIAILLSALLVVSSVAVFVAAESTNILAGKSYELSGCGVRSTYTANLTDGAATSDLTDYGTNWFGFYCNGEDQSIINAPDKVGYVIFDLEGTYKLDKIRANIICNDSWGIPAPAGIAAYVSDDGDNWTKADDFSYTLEAGVASWIEITGDWTAKFLKVEFTLAGTFAFVNEIEAYGVEATAEESSDVVEDSSDVVEDESSEVESSDDVSSDAPAVDGSAIEEDLKALVGEAKTDAKFDCVIDAPATYKAGDEIVVTVTIDNITVADGLDYIKFMFNYDNNERIVKMWSQNGEIGRASAPNVNTNNVVLRVEANGNSIKAYINGNLADESDDLVDDTMLYFMFVSLASRARYIGGSKAWDDALVEITESYQEPVPGGREKLIKVLKIMLTVWCDNMLKTQAETMIAEL